ncbi:MAG TPA: hypothetical protein VHY08_14130 [Bacillota bacterium]|nr:hypothetical protein [Bacillota bacterium]
MMSVGQNTSTVTNEYQNPFQFFTRFFQNLNRWYDEVLDGPCRRKTIINLAIATIVLVLLEYLAYQVKGVFSWIGARVWLLMTLWYFICLFYIFFRALGKDIKERRYISLLVIAIILVLVCYGVGNPYILSMNYESVLQVPQGVNDFETKPDFNYTGFGFDTPDGTLGYPARQYLLLAVPTLVLGHTFLALHLGYCLLFLTGLFICYAGFRTLIVKKWKANPLIAALAVLSIFTFPFLLEFLKIFEQPMLPMGFAMHAIGWFFLLLDRFNWHRLLNVMWVGGLLATTYTPALALCGIFLVMIVLLALAYAFNVTKYLPTSKLTKTSALIGLSCVFVYTVCFGAFTFWIRANQTIAVRPINEVVTLLQQGFQVFFLEFIGVLLPVVVLYFLLALTLRFGFGHFVMAGWVLGVVALSVAMNGYDNPEPRFALNRALLLIPPLMICVFWAFLDWTQKNKVKLKNTYLYVLMVILIAASGYNFSQQLTTYKYYPYFNWIKPVRYLLAEVVDQAKAHGISQTSKPELIFITDDALKTNYADYMKFFFPHAPVQVIHLGKSWRDLPLHKVNYDHGVIVYADKGTSFAKYRDMFGIPDQYPIEKYTLPVLIDNAPYEMERIIVPPPGK